MSNLQTKLISEKHFELMFQGADLTMGVKRLPNYCTKSSMTNLLFKGER